MLGPEIRQVNEGDEVGCVPKDQLTKNRVGVEKLLSARNGRNHIASGCPINDLLEFRDISGHLISPE